MAVETGARFELHWKPKPQAPSSGEVIDVKLNSSTCVGHASVKIIYRHALEGDAFVDSTVGIANVAC